MFPTIARGISSLQGVESTSPKNCSLVRDQGHSLAPRTLLSLFVIAEFGHPKKESLSKHSVSESLGVSIFLF